MQAMNICLMNDAFYPTIDGVTTVVHNYAEIINRDLGSATVVVPRYPKFEEPAFSFPVIRYSSVPAGNVKTYRAGIPFSPTLLQTLARQDFQIYHSHTPFMSLMAARMLRERTGVPIIQTYHTKFEIEIAKAVHNRHVQNAGAKLIVDGLNACDELWVVSRGARDSLSKLGYHGDSVVMPNGVDLPRERIGEDDWRRELTDVDLPAGVPVLLFVGRMMWYKGIRMILDALKLVREKGRDFRMIFLGSGEHLEEIRTYTALLGLEERVCFHPAIGDRERIRRWYSAADLFLFPSTFDTSGLVVQEAAACGVASVMIRDSCVAENAVDGGNAFLIDEEAASLAALLLRVMDDRALLRRVGEGAQRELYLSWDDAVHRAGERYHLLLERKKRGQLHRHTSLGDGFFRLSSRVLKPFGKREP